MADGKKSLILFEVDISHPCWFVDLTEKSKDCSGRTIRTISIEGDNITNLVEIRSPQIDKDIDFLRKHELVKKVEVLAKSPLAAVLAITSSYKAMTFKILHKSGAILLESPVTRTGADSELLAATSYSQLRSLVKAWEEEGWTVRMKKKRIYEPEKAGMDMFVKSGFFDLDSAKGLLSDRQREAFELACDYGYYDVPKKISLEELSQRVGIAPPTLAEHLRKAEAKLLPLFLKVLRKL